MRQAERAKAGYWREIVEAQERSGVGVSAFCRRRRLSVGSLYWWRRRLRMSAKESATGGGFVEVSLRPAETDLPSGVELHLGEHLRICLSRGFDGQTLQRVLALVGNRER